MKLRSGRILENVVHLEKENKDTKEDQTAVQLMRLDSQVECYRELFKYMSFDTCLVTRVKIHDLEFIDTPFSHRMRNQFRAKLFEGGFTLIQTLHGTTRYSASRIKIEGFNTATVWSSQDPQIACSYAIGRSSTEAAVLLCDVLIDLTQSSQAQYLSVPSDQICPRILIHLA
jgi:hypothetical protein